MKFEHNWQHKTLENLEKDIWKFNPDDDTTGLVKECNALRKKQLKDFTTEDLRVMILQNIGLNYLIPLAIDRLRENILAEGIMYKGDLLYSVLASDVNYWKNHKDEWKEVKSLYIKSRKIFEEDNTHRQTRKCFEKFEKILHE